LPYRLKVDHENLPPGVEVYVHGLGTFENGQTYDISDELALQFRAFNSTVESTYEEINGEQVIRRTENGMEILEPRMGPALEDAIDGMHGFSLVSDDNQKESGTPSTSDGLTSQQQAAVDDSMRRDIAEQGGQQ
jgi:hypothetical protein